MCPRAQGWGVKIQSQVLDSTFGPEPRSLWPKAACSLATQSSYLPLLLWRVPKDTRAVNATRTGILMFFFIVNYIHSASHCAWHMLGARQIIMEQWTDPRPGEVFCLQHCLPSMGSASSLKRAEHEHKHSGKKSLPEELKDSWVRTRLVSTHITKEMWDSGWSYILKIHLRAS